MRYLNSAVANDYGALAVEAGLGGAPPTPTPAQDPELGAATDRTAADEGRDDAQLLGGEASMARNELQDSDPAGSTPESPNNGTGGVETGVGGAADTLVGGGDDDGSSTDNISYLC